MNVALVTPQMATGERGGAEVLYHGVIGALREAGHEVDQVSVLTDESSFPAVLESYARCYALDLCRYDLVISTKAPTFMASHPNHVSFLLHTLRVFYDRFEAEYGAAGPQQQAQRRTIHALDRFGLRPGRVRRHFGCGNTSFQRLFDASPWWRRIAFRALHCPPAITQFKRPTGQDYFFMPGRLHRWKRVGLVIEAYKHFTRDVPLLIAGTGEDESALRAMAGSDRRIRFLGAVDDSTLVDLYAGALLVPFVPVQEDYGFVTIEAFKSGKPVLTCVDSGEPLEFVRDAITGYVVEPDPKAIAARLTHAADHRRAAAQMGRRANIRVSDIGWSGIVDALLGHPPAVRRSRKPRATSRAAAAETFSVAVLDMQPIDPPLGGGRLRLLGLYHGLGAQLPTTYVGTYDWPGERARRHRLSPTLEEIDVPLSDAHFAAADDWRQRAGNRTIIDSAFPQLARHSPEYVAEARRRAADADIVVFSHPWVYPLVKDVLRRRPQLVVYDAHNVEGALRLQLLGDDPFGARIAAHAAVVERELCREADLLLACSHEDRRLFHALYDVPFRKCLVLPNGAFTERVPPPDANARDAARRALDLAAGPVALFIGSLYGPNADAARFINGTLAAELPDVTFVICGGAGEAVARSTIAANVRVTLTVPEEVKQQYLAAADIAINPIDAGSGTNIKLFDFMTASLPIVTTPVGARGVRAGSEPSFVVAGRDAFADAIRRTLGDRTQAAALGDTARRTVRDHYSWERISPALGRILLRYRRRLGQSAPAASIVVPTFERHAHLAALMECLSRQTRTDFEVIVVDQSAEPWTDVPPVPFELVYVHTDVRGAGHARNSGALLARAEVLAFTDDDCRPDPDWVENGLRYFDRTDVAGVEGLILSDRAHDERYRPVTNVGFEGIGFMTANLWLRREVFAAIDGFDGQFDRPHAFREDTDLAWRALQHGAIPYAADVCVYHPPQPRTVERETLASRVQFFEKDALLLQKHPDRYRTLFLRERHYSQTPGFADHFLRGAAKYGVEIDDFYRSRCAASTGCA